MHNKSEALRIQLEREYRKLQKCFHDFNVLKQSLSMLSNISTKSASKTKKDEEIMAIRLERFFPEGISQLQREASNDMKELEKKFKQLITRIKHEQKNIKDAMKEVRYDD